MAKRKSFADDGWAVWVLGDDTSTVYLDEWVNPQGKSYVDVSVRIRGVKNTRGLNVYIPFVVEKSEIEDLSHNLKDENLFRAIFSTRCIMDYMKNLYTSEIAYHGKTVVLVHISCTGFTLQPLATGTLMTIPFDTLLEYLDNDEAYFRFRMPHKSLNELFKKQVDVKDAVTRLRDLLTSPVLSEKYACSVRVNEARLLPDEINQISAFHRQKLKKVVVTLSLQEDYQVNDSNCYRIHRLEQELYGTYAPNGFHSDDIITYEWVESRDRNFHGHFNFYFGISRETISKSSMFLYMILLFLVGFTGDALYEMLFT
jgi:hypothetical protein